MKFIFKYSSYQRGKEIESLFYQFRLRNLDFKIEFIFENEFKRKINQEEFYKSGKAITEIGLCDCVQMGMSVLELYSSV